jgi:hypothetical protein
VKAPAAAPGTRLVVPAIASAALALLALPAPASAATQVLSVEKKGTGTGTVTSSPVGIACGAACSAPFTEGTAVVLTGVPGANTAEAAWAGCDSVNLENKCKVTMSAAKAVTATFDLIQRPLKVTMGGTGTGTVTSSPAGIECGGTCQASFTRGTAVTLTAVSGANTEAASWSGCDSTSEGKCKVTMSAAKAVTATFSLEKHQLTVAKAGAGTGTVTSSPAGIACGGACAAGFDHGATVTLTGSPGAGSLAVQWAGCTSVDAENRCLVAMSAAKSVTATFKLPQLQLTVAKNGSGLGTVTSSPAGIECGGTCLASYEQGTSVTLTATPGANSQPAQWAGCDSVNAEGKCLVTMGAARSVTATFSLEKHQLTVAKAGPGAATSAVTSSPAGIECGAACAAPYKHGTAVTLTAVPGPHIMAAQWAGCDSVTGENKCLVTISAARSVTATFSLQPGAFLYPLTVERTGTGAGTVTSSPVGIECGVACSAELVEGAKLTLTATAAPGSAFAHWSGACGGTGACRVTISAARSVKAKFTVAGVRTLTVAKAGTGTGTVTGRRAGIQCGASCSAPVAAGAKVTLRATAAPVSTFAGFSGACSGTKACTVAMTEARSVTATFSALPASTLRLAATARVRGARALLRASCEGTSSCKGLLRLTARLRSRSVVIGQARFRLAAGSPGTVEVRLSARARRLLDRTGRLRARVAGAGVQARAVRLKRHV